MPNLTSIARPYALAAFDYAKDHQQLSAWIYFMQFAAQIAASKEILRFIGNPEVSADKLCSLFESILGDAIGQEQSNFLKLIAEHKRFNVLPQIYDEFNKLYAALEKVSSVKVVTAINLQDDYKHKLIQTLTKRIQREVTLECEVDPSILGGAIFYIGDQVIDGSIRGKLTRLLEFSLR